MYLYAWRERWQQQRQPVLWQWPRYTTSRQFVPCQLHRSFSMIPSVSGQVVHSGYEYLYILLKCSTQIFHEWKNFIHVPTPLKICLHTRKIKLSAGLSFMPNKARRNVPLSMGVCTTTLMMNYIYSYKRKICNIKNNVTASKIKVETNIFLRLLLETLFNQGWIQTGHPLITMHTLQRAPSTRADWPKVRDARSWLQGSKQSAPSVDWSLPTKWDVRLNMQLVTQA